MESICMLLDSRAAFADEIPETSVLLVGSANECCDAANSGEYGEDCVVSNQSMCIMWEWLATGKWIPE